jgi:hypothetical protein
MKSILVAVILLTGFSALAKNAGSRGGYPLSPAVNECFDSASGGRLGQIYGFERGLYKTQTGYTCVNGYYGALECTSPSGERMHVQPPQNNADGDSVTRCSAAGLH